MADGRYGRGETTALSLQHTSSCACDTITPVQAGRMALSGKGQGSGRPFVPFSGRAMIFPRSPQEGSAMPRTGTCEIRKSTGDRRNPTGVLLFVHQRVSPNSKSYSRSPGDRGNRLGA